MLVARITLVGVALASATFFAFSADSADAADGPTFRASRIADQRDASGSASAVDRIPISPVVLMTRSGPTLLGGNQLSTISIYSNGLITVSQADGASGTSSAGQAIVDPSYVDDLRSRLRSIGAHRLGDAQYDAYDVPLNTVTVFFGGQDARAHTFSYWIPDGAYRDVDDAILGFLTEPFLRASSTAR